MKVHDFHERAEIKAEAATEALAYRVIGAAIEVHSYLGPGLSERVYCEALSHELTLRGIAHQREVPVPIFYKGKQVGEGVLDFLVEGRLIIECKSVESLTPIHRAQTIGYLKATKLQLALLVNFNVAILKDGIKRILNTH
jgi:GxxExxY protein